MKNKEIKIEWEKFNREYKKYLISWEETWKFNLEKIKKYIDEFKKRPSIADKNKKISNMGKWLTVQKTQYKKKSI